MTDIVERLLNHKHPDEVVDEQRRMAVDLQDAAYEIKRLRDALAPFSCTCIDGYCQYQQFDGGAPTCPHNIARSALEEKK